MVIDQDIDLGAILVATVVPLDVDEGLHQGHVLVLPDIHVILDHDLHEVIPDLQNKNEVALDPVHQAHVTKIKRMGLSTLVVVVVLVLIDGLVLVLLHRVTRISLLLLKGVMSNVSIPQ